jgi:hypothetical protein
MIYSIEGPLTVLKDLQAYVVMYSFGYFLMLLSYVISALL